MEKELKKLKILVSGSAAYTKSQLQGIDTNLLVGSLISLIITLGISIFSNVLLYWIPSSFILMFLWTIYSTIFLRKKQNTNVDGNQKSLTEKQVVFGSYAFSKNFTAITNAIGIMFGINFISLVFYITKIINTEISFSTKIPIISTCAIIGLIIFVSVYLNGLYKKGSSITKEVTNLPSLILEKGKKGCFLMVITLLFGLFAFIVLPIWTLVVASPIYASKIENIPFILLVLVLQIIIILSFSSYFSSISAKKELTNAITNYSILDNMISQHLISNSIDENTYKELLNLYRDAKCFELKVDDYAKIVNFYLLFPNKIYFDNLK